MQHDVSLAGTLHFLSLVPNTGPNFSNASVCVFVFVCGFMYTCVCICGGQSSTMVSSSIIFQHVILRKGFFFYTEPRSHQLARLAGNSGDPPFSITIPVLVVGAHHQTFPITCLLRIQILVLMTD